MVHVKIIPMDLISGMESGPAQDYNYKSEVLVGFIQSLVQRSGNSSNPELMHLSSHSSYSHMTSHDYAPLNFINDYTYIKVGISVTVYTYNIIIM